MRRIVIFLLVLAVGLGVLFTLDRRGRQAEEEAREGSTGLGSGRPETPLIPDEHVGSSQGEGPSEGEDPGNNDAGGEASGVGEVDPDPAGDNRNLNKPRAGIDGGTSFSHFDPISGKRDLQFTADVKQADDGTRFDFTLREVLAEQFVPEDGAELRTLRAKTGRARLEVDARFRPTLLDEGHVSMLDVTMEQQRDLEYAPVTITTDKIDAYLYAERFVTPEDSPVVVQGNGLDAEGRGLDFDAPAERFNMAGGGWVEVVGEEGRTARVSAKQGPLIVEPREGGLPGQLRLLASGGAELQATGTPALGVLADEIEVFALKRSDGIFVVESVFSRGDVTVTHGLDIFRGQAAEAGFDAAGKPVSLEVSGQPVVAMTLEDENGVPLLVEASGEGPVKLLLSKEGSSFEFQGPGELLARDRNLVVNFRTSLEGFAQTDRTEGRFEAVGDTVFRQGESELRSERIEAEILAGDQRAANVLASGPTRAQALDEQGRKVELAAAGDLELEVREEDWRVPEARDVRVNASGKNPFQANAGRIRDFQWLSRTFEASEGVGYLSPFGAASGERLDSREGGVRHLEGSEDEPARLVLFPSTGPRQQLRSGNLQANVIDVHPLWAEARGSAELRLAEGARAVEANADFLRLSTTEPDADGGRPLRIDGDEITRVQVTEPGQVLTLSGGVLEVEGIYLPASDDDGSEEEDGAGNAQAKDWLWLEKLRLAGAVRVLGEGDLRLNVEAEEFELETYRVGGQPGERPAEDDLEFRWTGQAVRRLHAVEQGRETYFTGQSVELIGRAAGVRAEEPTWSVVSALAEGNVHARLQGDLDADVRAERIQLHQDRRLEAMPRVGGKVTAKGMLPGGKIDYSVRADRFETSPERLVAIGIDAEVGAPLLPIDAPRVPGVDTSALMVPGGNSMTVVKAARLEATPTRVDFYGGVEANGTDRSGVPVSLRAALLTLIGDRDRPGTALEQLDSVQAQGPFTIVYGGLGRVSGDRFELMQSRIKLQGEPALLESAEMAMESTRIDVDLNTFLISAERGVVRGTGLDRPWSLEFASIAPRISGEDTLMVVASPVYAELERTARAVWTTGWVKAEAWRARGRELLFGEPMPLEMQAPVEGPVRPPAPAKADLVQEAFSRLYAGTLSKYLRAVLLEGEVEATVRGRRVARSDAIYMNLEGGRGWLRGVELTYDLAISGRAQSLRTRAGEFVSQSDGSLVAENAILTTCTHDVPHYTVRTGELSLQPRKDGRWRFSAVRNRIIFRHGIQLPLPPIRNVVLDESGDFEGFESESGEVTTVENVVLQNTPRFGTSIGTRLAFDIGKLGKSFAKLLSFDNARTRGRWRSEGSWLSSRGPLLGVGLELRERTKDPGGTEDYWMDFWVRGIPDTGDDRGLVRVPSDDRDTLRNWFNIRGRYPFDDRQWIDVVVNTQNDAGVQAEFFEGRFQTFEERETYLHWRKARDGNYFSGQARWQIDSFRSEIEQLPSLGAQLGRRTIAKIGSVPILHTGTLDVANLRRRPGDPDFEPLFSTGVDVGFNGPGNNRTVLRADTLQRFELGLSHSGVQLTPFLEGRATGWDGGLDPDETPGRASLHGGIELSTSLVKSGRAGYHTLAPVARYSYELSHEQSGGRPVVFDGVEDATDGNTLELGLQSIWRRPAAGDSLDIQVLARQRFDRDAGLADQEELRLLGGFRTEFGGIPVAMLYDGRYDTVNEKTAYSNTTFAVRPFEPLVLEIGFQYGRDDDLVNLFELARFQGTYTISPKWEVSTVNWVDTNNQDSLFNQFVLRRFAHDFVLEMGVSTIAGEGGTAFSFNFSPLLAFKRPRTGLLDRR